MRRTAPPVAGPRRRPGRVALVALVAVAASVVAAPTSAQDENGSGPVDAGSLRREYEDLAGEEADTLVAYDLATARLTDLLSRVQEAQQAVAAAEQGLLEAEAALAADREVEAEAEAALEQARERVTRAEGRLRAHAVESYMGEGGATALAAFLAVLDGDDGAVARRGYRETISDQQKALVDELVAARREADRRSRQAAAARERSQARRDDIERLRAAATDALAEAARLSRQAADEQALQGLLLNDIRARKVSIEARIVSLDKAADGVAQLLAAYQAGDPDWQAGAVTVTSPSPGSPIVSEFGQRAHPILNLTRLHAGCDIDAPNGSPVRAAADGVVLLAAEGGGYGLTVVVAHGNSLGTVYAHNSSISVAVGDRVAQGDELAKVGSTGLSTGPHIHFETRLRGVPVNPRNFLN